jgi:hypothetical protein
MPQRLTEIYHPGDAVDVFFAEEEEWQPGWVRAHQHPGVWVQTEDQRLWFVTNGGRIRPRASGSVAPE